MRLAKSGVTAATMMLASAVFLAASGPASAQQQMGPNMMNPNMMNPNMMSPGMMNQGFMNQGMMNPGMMGGPQGCPGLMGQGMMGGGMMGSGMTNPMMGMMHQGGMMGPGMMGGGMMGMMRDDDMHPGMMAGGMMGGGGGAGYLMLPAPAQLSAADVTYNLERILAARGNPHLKVGKVEDKDADTIVGEVVTTEGSLVERYEVDKRSGFAKLVP